MPIMKAWTYITTNARNKVLYTGVTSNLKSRIENHKNKKYPNAFTARYNADRLVWFQEFDSIIDAREREKQLKAGNRARKIKLIETMNPEWKDLFKTL
jgi:putative endonuclease